MLDNGTLSYNTHKLAALTGQERPLVVRDMARLLLTQTLRRGALTRLGWIDTVIQLAEEDHLATVMYLDTREDLQR
jgi:hypothetical protein